nr:hypothetical protein [uncultured Campylobacter sp.]
MRTLNLTPNLLKTQTRSRQIYRAAPTKTSQGSVKFISLKFELNLRANFTKRRGEPKRSNLQGGYARLTPATNLSARRVSLPALFLILRNANLRCFSRAVAHSGCVRQHFLVTCSMYSTLKFSP